MVFKKSHAQELSLWPIHKTIRESTSFLASAEAGKEYKLQTTNKNYYVVFEFGPF